MDMVPAKLIYSCAMRFRATKDDGHREGVYNCSRITSRATPKSMVYYVFAIRGLVPKKITTMVKVGTSATNKCIILQTSI